MLKHLAAVAAILALLATPALAKVQQMKVDTDGQISFVMPSGNVGCIYTPEGGTDIYQPANGGPELQCDRIEPDYVTVILGTDAEPEMIDNPGEQGCCGGVNTFKYGYTIELDGFICTSKKTGLRCKTDDGEHGFSMARAGVETY